MAETNQDISSLYIDKSFGKDIKTYLTDIPTDELDKMVEEDFKISGAADSLVMASNTWYDDKVVSGVFTLYYCDYDGKLHRLTYPVNDKRILETIASSLNDLNVRLRRIEERFAKINEVEIFANIDEFNQDVREFNDTTTTITDKLDQLTGNVEHLEGLNIETTIQDINRKLAEFNARITTLENL